MLEVLEISIEEDSDKFRTSKSHRKMIKRLLDTKMLREQEFYLGDWVLRSKTRAAAEIIDINYKLRTAKLKIKEGEIWVKFNDIIKDDDFCTFNQLTLSALNLFSFHQNALSRNQ